MTRVANRLDAAPPLARKGDAAPMGLVADRLQDPPRIVLGKKVLATPVAARQPAVASADILIIEDDRLNLKLYRDLLEARGHRTTGTRDTNRVMAALRLARPDLILIDLCPPFLTGLECAREIKRDPTLRDIPIIAVAELFRREVEAAIRDNGCDACIAKPISVPEFLRVIEANLSPAIS